MDRRIERFWQRISDGIAIQQLWEQFRADAHASYQLYSKEVESGREGESRWQQIWRTVCGVFWAMMMKLSPGRRILLLVALVILCVSIFHMRFGDAEFDTSGLGFWGGAILLLLLALE